MTLPARRFADSGAKCEEVGLAQFAFGEICGRCVCAALWLAVGGEVLRGGHHVVAVNKEGIALESFDGGNADARTKIGILSIGFFGAAPAGIARQIENRREGLAFAGSAHFLADSGKDLFHQNGIPGAGEPKGLRKAGAAVGHVAVQAFAKENVGNAEPGFLQLVALQGVVDECALTRADFIVDIVELFKYFFGIFVGQLAGGVDQAFVGFAAT